MRVAKLISNTLEDYLKNDDLSLRSDYLIHQRIHYNYLKLLVHATGTLNVAKLITNSRTNTDYSNGSKFTTGKLRRMQTYSSLSANVSALQVSELQPLCTRSLASLYAGFGCISGARLRTSNITRAAWLQGICSQPNVNFLDYWGLATGDMQPTEHK